MRVFSSAALWAACVFLLVGSQPWPHALSSTAHAQPGARGKTKKKANQAKKVNRCVRFNQTLGQDEESVDLQLANQCKYEVVCSLEWEVVCTTPDGAQSVAEGSRSSTLNFSDEFLVNASASACEQDWEIDKVRWNCLPAEM